MIVTLTEQEFHIIDSYVRTNFGLNLEKKQYLVECRIGAELDKCGAKSFSEYWGMLRRDATGRMEQGLMDCLTTQYTFFCREEQHFDFISRELAAKYDHSPSIWCAGCATGQESYTLAMQMAELRENGRLRYDYRIVATDVSKEAISAALTGIYRRDEYERLPERWRSRFCMLREDGGFIVTTRIRDTVRYLRHNLMEPWPGGNKFDIVFCRNVLIYFQENERAAVVANLVDAMKPGGYLLIGHTESLIGCGAKLEYIKPAVYRKPKAVITC